MTASSMGFRVCEFVATLPERLPPKNLQKYLRQLATAKVWPTSLLSKPPLPDAYYWFLRKILGLNLGLIQLYIRIL